MSTQCTDLTYQPTLWPALCPHSVQTSHTNPPCGQPYVHTVYRAPHIPTHPVASLMSIQCTDLTYQPALWPALCPHSVHTSHTNPPCGRPYVHTVYTPHIPTHPVASLMSTRCTDLTYQPALWPALCPHGVHTSHTNPSCGQPYVHIVYRSHTPTHPVASLMSIQCTDLTHQPTLWPALCQHSVHTSHTNPSCGQPYVHTVYRPHIPTHPVAGLMSTQCTDLTYQPTLWSALCPYSVQGTSHTNPPCDQPYVHTVYTPHIPTHPVTSLMSTQCTPHTPTHPVASLMSTQCTHLTYQPTLWPALCPHSVHTSHTNPPCGQPYVHTVYRPHIPTHPVASLMSVQCTHLTYQPTLWPALCPYSVQTSHTNPPCGQPYVHTVYRAPHINPPCGQPYVHTVYRPHIPTHPVASLMSTQCTDLTYQPTLWPALCPHGVQTSHTNPPCGQSYVHTVYRAPHINPPCGQPYVHTVYRPHIPTHPVASLMSTQCTDLTYQPTLWPVLCPYSVHTSHTNPPCGQPYVHTVYTPHIPTHPVAGLMSIQCTGHLTSTHPVASLMSTQCTDLTYQPTLWPALCPHSVQTSHTNPPCGQPYVRTVYTPHIPTHPVASLMSTQCTDLTYQPTLWPALCPHGVQTSHTNPPCGQSYVHTVYRPHIPTHPVASLMSTQCTGHLTSTHPVASLMSI